MYLMNILDCIYPTHLPTQILNDRAENSLIYNYKKAPKDKKKEDRRRGEIVPYIGEAFRLFRRETFRKVRT